MENIELFKTCVITLFSILLVASAFIIKKLKNQIVVERNKRIIPHLEIKVDSDNEMAFFIENTGDCVAKDIVFIDTEVTLESGIKKTFKLTFDPIDQIKPKGIIRLNYNVIDGEITFNPANAKSLFVQITSKEFELHIKYSNLYNTSFESHFKNAHDHFKIISMGPVDIIKK